MKSSFQFIRTYHFDCILRRFFSGEGKSGKWFFLLNLPLQVFLGSSMSTRASCSKEWQLLSMLRLMKIFSSLLAQFVIVYFSIDCSKSQLTGESRNATVSKHPYNSYEEEKVTSFEVIFLATFPLDISPGR